MEFSVTEKHNSIYVKVYGPEPWRPQTFYPLIDRLNEQIKDSFLRNRRTIVFDFLELNFVDSYMISMLVQTSRLTEPKKNIILVTDNQVLSIITLIGIDKIYTVYHSEKEWLQA